MIHYRGVRAVKPFILSAFLLVAGVAWSQADDGRDAIMPSELREIVADNKIIYGSKVDFDAWTIFGKGFEMLFAPRTFRKNWPFYGYAVPKNKKPTGLCDQLKERHPNLTIGEAAMVLSKEYNATSDSTSFGYIGFPVKSVAVPLVAPAENKVSQSVLEYPELRIRDICSWLEELPNQTMLRIGALPYDLPEGNWAKVSVPSGDLLTLMAGKVGDPNDTGTTPSLVWSELNEAAETGRKIVWTPVSRNNPPANPLIKNGYIWWRYTPKSKSRGNYYLSWKPSGSDVRFNPKVTNWSLPSGKMEWYEMPEGDNLAHTPFMMWYAPGTNSTDRVMASTQTARKWYLLTEEPLPRLDADIRFKFHSASIR